MLYLSSTLNLNLILEGKILTTSIKEFHLLGHLCCRFQLSMSKDTTTGTEPVLHCFSVTVGRSSDYVQETIVITNIYFAIHLKKRVNFS